MGLRFLKIAVVYLILGALLGVEMEITQQFALAPVHARLLLLGWASMALAGLIYHLDPDAAQTWLARIPFWVHNPHAAAVHGLPGVPAFQARRGIPSRDRSVVAR